MVKSMTVYPVRTEDVGLVWERCEGFLLSAVAFTHGAVLVGDIKKLAEENKVRIWVVENEGVLTASLVTELIQYPQYLVCRIFAMGGVGLAYWERILEAVERWARLQGATRMETFCRPGVAKELLKYNYEKVCIVVGKHLGELHE